MYLKPSRAISTHLDLTGVCFFLPAPCGNQPLVAPACRAKGKRRRESHRRRTCRAVVRRKGWEFWSGRKGNWRDERGEGLVAGKKSKRIGTSIQPLAFSIFPHAPTCCGRRRMIPQFWEPKLHRFSR